MADYSETDVPDQSGKTVLVTGANTGIGYDTARVLAGRGARVLLGCRSEDKALQAMAKIRVSHPDADVDWVALDLTSLSSIAAAAEQVNNEDRLDLLINNAGVMVPPKTLTEDGFELQFGVNHLGHFALTGHLVGKLKDQPGGRVVNVSSLAHRSGQIDYADIHAEKNYSALKRYSMSKFANILFTYELQRRLTTAGSPLISVASHPGASATELSRYIPKFMALLFAPFALIMNTSAQGALPSLMAASAAGVVGGDYYGPMRMGEMQHSARKVDTIAHAKNEQDAARLWAVSEDLTGVSYAL